MQILTLVHDYVPIAWADSAVNRAASAPKDTDDMFAVGDAGTMHRLKGLEFRAVVVIGVEEGIVPHLNEISNPAVQAANIQRERCLLFVACTRARDALTVSHVGAPSPFLT